MTTMPETGQGEVTEVPFRAEVQQLLQILSHSLYTEREIFLRELISNASDALHRIQFEMATNQDVVDPDAELAIRVEVDKDAKTITVSDTGVGMTRDEMVTTLGTIAQSGVRAAIEQLEAAQRSDIIGQFGVGFYSVFAVADRVTVTSRSFRPGEAAARWEATGGDSFTVSPAEREQRGTTIEIHLKDDATEFAESWRIEQAIKKHSNFVAFPIYLGDRQVNERKALWRRAPREVEQETYNEFYRQLTFDFQPPLHHLHISTEAPFDLHALLFVPSTRERGLIERRTEGRLKLYSRSILIQEENKELLPQHFRFVEGVVDSDELPLNVSREAVQRSPLIQRISKTLTSRLVRDLEEMAEKEPEKYLSFWHEFGPFLKEGVATDVQGREQLARLLRFSTTKSDDGLSSLAEYKGRMIKGQEAIYYVLADSPEAARRSAHLDPLYARGIEALLLTEVLDSFMLTGLAEFDGTPLRNVDDPNLTLPGAETAEDREPLGDEELGRLGERFKQVLGERVTEVRPSAVLRTNPVRLVSPADVQGREMQRIQRLMERDYTVPAKIMELNRTHPLIHDLAGLIQSEQEQPTVDAVIEQLYDSALLSEGLHPDPARMLPRIELLMEAAARHTPR
ncbi:MAG: molecular chaperone HtpG [Chloroflexota bacterium]|nr:molecular chaperone HtpG [Chloroflexota bacterium]